MSNMTKDEESENLHKADQVYFLYDPQPVRLLDVIYVGPVMIYGGIKGKFHPFVKWSLIGVGICTILYNGANFYINEKRAMEKRKAQQDAIKRALLQEQAQENEQMMSVIDIQPTQKSNVLTKVNIPIQVTVDAKDMDGMQLPPEVAELLNQPFLSVDGNPPIAKKGKGKTRATDAVIFEKQYIENGQDTASN